MRGADLARLGTLAALALAPLLAACETAGPCPDCLALVDVTVVDGLGNEPVPGQTVLVREGRIVEIGPDVAVPPAARRIEGGWVMPGLIDTHAHVTVLPASGETDRIDRESSEEVLRTLLAHGITTVRNPAAPTEAGVALREAVARGEIPGPQIVTAGAALNPRAFAFGPSAATPDAESVRQEVRRQAEAGVDLIKVYAAMPPDLIAVAVDEAHAHGLEVVGHLQRATWAEGARAGIDHLTHGAPWSAAYLPENQRDGYRGTILDRLDWLEAVEPEGEAWQATVRALASRGITVDPTLIAYRTKFVADDPAYRDSARLALAPESVRQSWASGSFTDGWTPEAFARGRAMWPRMLVLTRALHEGGVTLTAGSDLPNPWVVPGLSLHEELQLLVDAGIPPLDVLCIATSNGARSLRLGSEVGTVEVGRQADLVVLAADPTNDIANTRAIAWVIVNGVPFRPQDLLAP